METILAQFQQLITLVKANQHIVLAGIAAMWIVHLINIAVRYRLNLLGIYPRTVHGLTGIVFAPWLHGDFNHLFFNSIPLYVLANFVLLGGVLPFFHVTVVIIGISGALIWLFSRKGLHVGASGLIMGYWGYLVSNAYYHASVITVLLVIVSLYYFGGLLSSLLPSSEAEVSWEGHIFGFIAGVAANYI